MSFRKQRTPLDNGRKFLKKMKKKGFAEEHVRKLRQKRRKEKKEAGKAKKEAWLAEHQPKKRKA